MPDKESAAPMLQDSFAALPKPLPAAAPARPVAPGLALLDRERAILDFNRRVLAQALRADVPLLERLRYVCIVSSNLDEFFEVRFADYIEATRHPGTGVLARRPAGGGGRRARADRCAVRRLQRRRDAGARARGHRGAEPPRPQRGAARLGRRVLRARGAPAAGAGGARSRRTRFRRSPTSRSTSSCSSPARMPSAATTRSPSSRCRACCRA